MGERLYGLDWLRIGAFGLLIFYHIGMFFVSWDWHIKSPVLWPWLELPMLALNPWRLSLLFLISGTASAFLLAKMTPIVFARSRSARLLAPLIAGLTLFVAPQPWVELMVQHGYRSDFWTFWITDYFRLGKLDGVDLPTWNHLWFVAYIWAYSLVLAIAAGLVPGSFWSAVRRVSEAALSGSRMLLVPIALLWLLRATLYPLFPETHGLIDDWYNHAAYGVVFALGVLLAHSDQARNALMSQRWAALGLAVLGYGGYAAFYVAYPDGGPTPDTAMLALGRLARTFQAWGAIVALAGFALRWRPGDSAARRYFSDAIFPYYIAHQTVIILAAFWLRPLGLNNGPMFALLVVATVGGCALFHEVGKRAGLLRVFFGLKPEAVEKHSHSRSAAAH